MINKTIQSLNSKNKKFWKEKVEALKMITMMCKAGCCEDYIFGRMKAVISAIMRAKAGGKQIRDAAGECLEGLEVRTKRGWRRSQEDVERERSEP